MTKVKGKAPHSSSHSMSDSNGQDNTTHITQQGLRTKLIDLTEVDPELLGAVSNPNKGPRPKVVANY